MKRKLIPMLAFLFMFASLYGQNTPVSKANYRLAEQFSPNKLNEWCLAQQ